MSQLGRTLLGRGILEAEGNFRDKNNSPQVRASQVEEEPLQRLLAHLGGSLRPEGMTKAREPQAVWVWSTCGSRALLVMGVIYEFMSERRRAQIDAAQGRGATVAPTG